MYSRIRLTPAQETAAYGLLGEIQTANIFLLRAQPGMGRTTALHAVHAVTGGAFLRPRRGATDAHFLAALEQAIAREEVVFVDDLHLLTGADDSRTYLLDAALTSVLGEAAAQHKKVVFATAGVAPWPVRRRAATWRIGAFGAADYRRVCGVYLGAEVSKTIDYAGLHRCVPGRNAYQLKRACTWLCRIGRVTTERLIAAMRRL